MKRMLSVAVVSLLAAAFLSYSPASAHGVDVCVGNGTATAVNPVYYPTTPTHAPGLAPTAFGAVTFTFGAGGCLLAHGNTVNGGFTNSGDVEDLFDVGNYCGHSEGNVDFEDHLGHWVSAASMLVIYGGQTGVNGVVNAVPDPQLGSCLTGAKSFITTGAIVLL